MSGVTPTDPATIDIDEAIQAIQDTMSSGLFSIMASQFQSAIGDVSNAFSDDSSDPDAVA